MKQRNLPFKSIPVDKLEKGWVDHAKPPIGHFMQRFDNVLFRDFEEVMMSRHKEQNFVLNAMDSEPSIKKKKKLKSTSTVDDSHEVIANIFGFNYCQDADRSLELNVKFVVMLSCHIDSLKNVFHVWISRL